MRITFRRCNICTQFHNHVSCPYCGAFHVNNKDYNVVNGRIMARGLPLPRTIEAQLVSTVTRIGSNGQVTNRLSR
jgi:hypothetical protein